MREDRLDLWQRFREGDPATLTRIYRTYRDQVERLVSGQPTVPLVYHDKGIMATVGPRRAVVDAFGLHVSGFPGSVMWAFVHLYYLIGWGNRTVITLRWLLQMTTRTRSNRLVDVEHAANWRELRRRSETGAPGLRAKLRRARDSDPDAG